MVGRNYVREGEGEEEVEIEGEGEEEKGETEGVEVGSEWKNRRKR